MASRNSDLDPFQGFNIFKPGWKSFGPSVGGWTGSQPQKNPGIMQSQVPPVPTQSPVSKSSNIPFPHPDKVNPGIQKVAPSQQNMLNQPTAPATAWQWQPGQPPQWPIKPPPPGAIPYEVAQHNQIQEWANKPMPDLSDPARLAMSDEHNKAESDLYKSYHGGYGPVTYRSFADQGLIPGVQRQGGVSIYRGNAGGFGGESIAERDARLGRENAAIGIEQQRANAANLQAQAGMSQAQAALEEAQAKNPMRQGEWAVKHSDEARALAALEGRKAEDLAAFPPGAGNPIGPGNYSQQLQRYPDLARILTNPDLHLHEKLDFISKMPGADMPNHPIHQIAKSWLAEQMAAEDKRNEYAQEYEYPSGYRNALDRFLNRQLGANQRVAQRRQELDRLFNQFGYQFPGNSPQ